MKGNELSIRLRLREARKFLADQKAARKGIKATGDEAVRAGNRAGKAGKGFGLFRKNVDHTRRSSRLGAGAMRGLAGGIAGVVAGFIGMGAAKNAISTTIGLAKATSFLHNTTGMSVESAGAWAATAKVRGIEAKALNMAFGTLAKNIVKARDGGKTQLEAFDKLGISQRSLKASGGDLNKVLPQLSDGFNKLGKSPDRAASMMALMGRGWQTISPLMRDGSKAMNEQLAMANKYGATLGGKPLKTQQDLIAVQRELQFAQLGFQVQFATKVAPALIKGFGMMLKAANAVKPAFRWMKEHQDLVKVAAGVVLVAVGMRKLQLASRGARDLLNGITGGKGGRQKVANALRRVFGGARGVVSRIMGGVGRTGGATMATNVANTSTAQVGPKMSRKRGSWNKAGRSVGGTAGTQGGTAMANGFVGTSTRKVSSSAKGGRLRGLAGKAGPFASLGGAIGAVMAAAIVIPILDDVTKTLNDVSEKDSLLKRGLSAAGAAVTLPMHPRRSIDTIGKAFGAKRKGKKRRRGGGISGMGLFSPGEMWVTPSGMAGMIPGRRTAADSVMAGVPSGTNIFTDHGQGLLRAGASMGQALAHQLPHFAAGGRVAPRVEPIMPKEAMMNAADPSFWLSVDGGQFERAIARRTEQKQNRR